LRDRAAAPAPSARGKTFVLVASAFYPSISRALIAGATRTLRAAGASAAAIDVLWAPGCFELPVLARRAAARRPAPDAIIALGALIRGQTAQYEVIANAAAQGLVQLSVATGIPVTFGVIVAETPAQALARAGLGKRPAGHRGEEAAAAALNLLGQFARLPGSGRV
jgi:6,7-dimethyl-8-ribityllumazine synthase